MHYFLENKTKTWILSFEILKLSVPKSRIWMHLLSRAKKNCSSKPCFDAMENAPL
jgi:hypothetical protein